MDDYIMMYDPRSNAYFRANKEMIDKMEKEMNDQLDKRCNVTLNELLYEIHKNASEQGLA